MLFMEHNRKQINSFNSKFVYIYYFLSNTKTRNIVMCIDFTFFFLNFFPKIKIHFIGVI